jgi:hypothetical protein
VSPAPREDAQELSVSNERLREAAQAVVDAREGLVPGYRSSVLDNALDDLREALSHTIPGKR